jgi:hypothetical protein
MCQFITRLSYRLTTSYIAKNGKKGLKISNFTKKFIKPRKYVIWLSNFAKMIFKTFVNNDKNTRSLTTVVSSQWSIRQFRQFCSLALPRSKFGKTKKGACKVFQRFQICFQINFTITRFSSSRTTSLTIFSIHD